MKQVILSAEVLAEWEEWENIDAKIVLKIVALIVEISGTPFTGTGKPEPLNHNLKGKWSRRITQEHRLVYEIKEEAITIISCKYHY